MQKKYRYKNALLIQFAKSPVAGEVKTRMISELGAQGACHLHELLTEKVMGNLVAGGLAKSYLYSNDPDSSKLQAMVENIGLQFNTVIPLRRQEGADLGQRMAHAFANHLLLDQNAARMDIMDEEVMDEEVKGKELKDKERKPIVVLVGSDCPALDASYIEQAINALDENNDQLADVVIGPADDGGYVLIAMNKAYLSLFDNIEWGSGRVFAQTLAAAKQLGLRLTVLKSLADIDRPADLVLLPRYGLHVNS